MVFGTLTRLDLNTRLLALIIISIGFQQFPVIRVGGSFKIYELLAIFYLFLNLFSQKLDRWNFTPINIFCLGFFVVSPTISYLSSIFILPYPSSFYRIYGATSESFKFNYAIFPALQLIYMFFNYSVFTGIVASNRLYLHFDKLLKVAIMFGTLIAIYSLFAMFAVDFIAKLPSFIQNKQPYHFRSSGLSQEPSFYVLFQTWIVLFIFYARKLYNHRMWLIFFTINLASLLLTLSTTLAALVAILLFSFFVLRNSLKSKFWLLTSLCLLFAGIYVVIITSANGALIEALFLNKVTNFFSAPEHTMDSGSFRSYTSRIGLEIFKMHPCLGVGVGNSIYYMHEFENKMGIVIFGETLFAGSFPQNTFSMILSEQGLFGSIFFVSLIYIMVKRFWNYRNFDNYCSMFFIGTLFTIAAMITIAPVYSMFLWVFPAFGLGYIQNFVKYQEKLNGIQG